MSLSYQTERVPAVQYDARTVTIQTNIYSTIYVSNYKIYETVVRRYITKIVSRYISPDGIEVTRIEIPTSYLESEYVSGMTTRFVGVQPVPVPPSQQTRGTTSFGVII
jgi:hypothetical protein